MNFLESHTVEVEPGWYLVGDPCYAIEDHMWMQWLEEADYDSEDSAHVLVGHYGRSIAVGVPTAFGDGVFYDQEGREYPVDAGLLGLVPTYAGASPRAGMHLMFFSEKASCWRGEDGVVHLGNIAIDTADYSNFLDDEDDEES